MISNICRPGGDRELKVHDGIVGTIVLLSVVAGVMANPLWFWLAGVTAAVMISSAFTGFCPLHYTLSKVMPAAD
jgi:type IV secretory pathway TrbD component